MEMPLDYYTVNVPPHQNPAKNLLEAIFQAANSYPAMDPHTEEKLSWPVDLPC